MKLSEVMANQEGWQLADVFLMNVKVEVMTYCPFIVNLKTQTETKRLIVVCETKEQLKKLWESCPKKYVEVTEEKFMINKEKKLAVQINPPASYQDSDRFYLVLDADEELRNNVEFVYADDHVMTFRDEARATFPA